MATKADFNAEEWATVVEAPVLAGLRVVAANRGGTIRESLAIGKVYTEARKSQGESRLLDELVASPPGVDARSLQAHGDIRAMVRERLHDALQLLETKADSQDVEAYKGFVVSVARAAAEAHKEGGFIGIGGKPVSEAEQAALDDLEGLLNTSALTGGSDAEHAE